MELIKQTALIDDLAGVNPQKEMIKLERIARVCTGTEDKLSNDSEQWVAEKYESHHKSILYFSNLTMQITTSRGVSIELLRHHVGLSFMQRSTRFCKEANSGNVRYILPTWFPETMLGVWDWKRLHKEEQSLSKANKIFVVSCLHNESDYNEAMAHNKNTQKAKDILNHWVATRLYMIANLEAYKNLLSKRMYEDTGFVYDQMLDLAKKVGEEVEGVYPKLFEQDWEKVRRTGVE